MNEKELLKLKIKKRMEQNEKTDLGRNCVMYVLRMGVLQFTIVYILFGSGSNDTKVLNLVT
jgi:hypothetical protein